MPLQKYASEPRNPMTTEKTMRLNADDIGADAHHPPDVRPSDKERANVAAFDKVAQSLGLTAKESRGRRWISRIGSLLRQARTHQKMGQETVAAKAEVTQPYLSRLENGLLPKRGPTIDVLLRCAEASGCEVDIAIRSKKDGRLLGHVSSGDLDRSSLESRRSKVETEMIELSDFPDTTNEENDSDAWQVRLAHGARPAAPGGVRISSTQGGRYLYVTRLRLGEIGVGGIARAKKGLRFERAEEQLNRDVSPMRVKTPQTLTVGKDDGIVIGSSTKQLTNAIAMAVGRDAPKGQKSRK